MYDYGNWAIIEETEKYLIIVEIHNYELDKFEIYNIEEKSLVGNIYRGKIKDKIPGLLALFVDIGLEKNGFLQLKEDEFSQFGEGKDIIVQVLVDSIDQKGPKLTNNYELKDEALILSPFNNKIRISKKIKNSEFIEKIKIMLNSTLIDNIGWVVRTKAESLTIEELELKAKSLLKFYKKIEKEKSFTPTPKLLIEDDNYDLYDFKNVDFIVTNSKKHFKKLKSKNFNVNLEKDFKVLNTKYYKEIKSIFERKLSLDNGIELVFDKTEALNVIDINSKGFPRNKKGIDLNDINKNAVKEIIKQIHFRNIYGIILIDFISINNKDKEKEILKLFKEYSKNYKNPINIIGFTKLGILELTRNKNVKNLKTQDLNVNVLR